MAGWAGACPPSSGPMAWPCRSVPEQLVRLSYPGLLRGPGVLAPAQAAPAAEEATTPAARPAGTPDASEILRRIKEKQAGLNG